MNGMQKLNTLIVLLVVLFLWGNIYQRVNGIELYVNLKPKQVKCIRERINKDTLVVGKFKSENNKKTFSAYVFDVDINEADFASFPKMPLFQSLNEYDIKTAFTTFYASSYSFCAFNNSDTKDRINVHFEIKFGTEAKDYTQIAKTEHLNVASVNIKQIIDQISNFHKNLLRLRAIEQEEKKSGDKLNDFLMWFSFITILIIIITAVLQDFYFKKFFTSKKII